jgi:hypothetical protein
VNLEKIISLEETTKFKIKDCFMKKTILLSSIVALLLVGCNTTANTGTANTEGFKTLSEKKFKLLISGKTVKKVSDFSELGELTLVDFSSNEEKKTKRSSKIVSSEFLVRMEQDKGRITHIRVSIYVPSIYSDSDYQTLEVPYNEGDFSLNLPDFENIGDVHVAMYPIDQYGNSLFYSGFPYKDSDVIIYSLLGLPFNVELNYYSTREAQTDIFISIPDFFEIGSDREDATMVFSDGYEHPIRIYNNKKDTGFSVYIENPGWYYSYDLKNLPESIILDNGQKVSLDSNVLTFYVDPQNTILNGTVEEEKTDYNTYVVLSLDEEKLDTFFEGVEYTQKDKSGQVTGAVSFDKELSDIFTLNVETNNYTSVTFYDVNGEYITNNTMISNTNIVVPNGTHHITYSSLESFIVKLFKSMDSLSINKISPADGLVSRNTDNISLIVFDLVINQKTGFEIEFTGSGDYYNLQNLKLYRQNSNGEFEFVQNFSGPFIELYEGNSGTYAITGMISDDTDKNMHYGIKITDNTTDEYVVGALLVPATFTNAENVGVLSPIAFPKKI